MDELLDEESNRSDTPGGDDTDDFEESENGFSQRGSPRPPQSRGHSSRQASDSAIPILYSSPRASNAGTKTLNANGGSNLSRLSNLGSLAGNLRLSESASDKNSTKSESEYSVLEPDTSYEKVPRPDELTIQEILGLLKVKTSMLALGACERVKRIAKAHPNDIIASPILAELIVIIKDGPGTPLAGASMSALSSMALSPEGRQKICVLGGATPLVKLVARGEVAKPNTDKAIGLLMNLAADQQNRRVLRQEGAIEAFVSVLKAAPMSEVLEHAMGALHNTMLTDSKSKVRAVEAGVLAPLLRVVNSKLDEGCTIMMRAKLLLGELMKVPGLESKLAEAATSHHA